jgi:hypothetical protein
MPNNAQISKECDALKELLLKKNSQYGDALSHPVLIFSDLTPEQRVRVMIDSKLTRLCNIGDFDNEDTITDLIGYLILLKIIKRNEG